MDSYLSRLKSAYLKHLSYAPGDELVIDLIYSTIVANRRRGANELVWVLIVGAPGTGKSESLIPLVDGKSGIYRVSQMTPKSLISGYRKNDDEEKDNSLLLQLDGKDLVIEDLTTIFSNPAPDIKRIMGVLRKSYDGRVESAYGNVGRIVYTPRFGVIAAATPHVDIILEDEQHFGQRFLGFRLGKDFTLQTIKRQVAHVVSAREGKQERRDALIATVQATLHDIDIRMALMGKDPVDSRDYKQKLEDLSTLVAFFRTNTIRKLQVTRPESPNRLVQQLTNLGDGRAVLDGRLEWNSEDYEFIVRVALDTLPVQVHNMVQHLYRTEHAVLLEDLSRESYMEEDNALRYTTQWISTKLMAREGTRYLLTHDCRTMLKEVGFFNGHVK